jgi:hypothetical protein
MHDTGLMADKHMWGEMSGRLRMQKDYLIEKANPVQAPNDSSLLWRLR